MKRVILLAVILISFNFNYFSYAGVGEGVSEVDTLSSIIPIIFISDIQGSHYIMTKNFEEALTKIKPTKNFNK